MWEHGAASQLVQWTTSRCTAHDSLLLHHCKHMISFLSTAIGSYLSHVHALLLLCQHHQLLCSLGQAGSQGPSQVGLGPCQQQTQRCQHQLHVGVGAGSACRGQQMKSEMR